MAVDDELQRSHTPQAITARLDQVAGHAYLKDFVYGAVDGTVTTFAIVAGVAGAQLSSSIIVVLGLANLIADGFSMAVGNYLGTNAENQQREKAREQERLHIQLIPEGEREEIRQILARKGFEGAELERAVTTITADVERWIDTMMLEELGLSPVPANSWRAAGATFLAFVAVGVIPLSPFLWNLFAPASIEQPLLWSAVATGVAFFAVGAAKSGWSLQRWYVSGSETLFFGGVAAIISFSVGALLRDLVPH